MDSKGHECKVSTLQPYYRGVLIKRKPEVIVSVTNRTDNKAGVNPRNLAGGVRMDKFDC